MQMCTLCHILYISGNAEAFSGFEHLCHKSVGLNSSVSVATHYRLDGPGIKFCWGKIFCTHPDRSGAHPASYTMGTGSFSQG